MKSWVWSRRRIAAIFLGAGATALIPFLLLSRQELKAGAFQDFNILLITLDTTRADHLPAYGYTGVKTPNLDGLANESYVFDDAVSHTPLTLPAHTSILTGMLPVAHGIRDNAGFFVDQKHSTLSEILKARGYSTSAFVSAFVLDSRWQLNQGFDVYHDYFSLEEFNQLTPQDAQRRAEETASEAEAWLFNRKGDPFFSWVHFYDPHDPYDPPEPFKTDYVSSPYDGEIAYMDVSIGRLLRAISSSGLEKNTIVIVTADHGEGLGEHQEETHAMFVYDTTQRIPLLIRVPGAAAGKRVGALARHIDLAPTILDLLGIEVNSQMQGSSLVPFMNGAQDSNRSAYMESLYAELHFGWSPVRSLVTSRFKYIDSPKPELYDRIQDPAETRNLIIRESAQAKTLKDELDQVVAGYQNSSGPQEMDPETEAGLRALGYIGVTTGQSDRSIDPKDRIHLARNLQLATAHLQNQQYESAVQLLLAVMEEDPAITDAHFLAGVSYIGLGKFDDAIRELIKSLAVRPNHVMSLYNLGYAHERKGEDKEALHYFLTVLQQEPLHLFANLKTAHLYRRVGDSLKARPYFLNVAGGYQRLVNNTRNANAKSALHARIGEAFFGAGHLLEAEKQFRSAIELTPQKPDLYFNLGSIYEVEGKVDAAAQAYIREIEVNSGNYKAFNNLGLIYQRAGRLEDAAACFEKIVNLIPDEPRGYLMLASVYREMGRVQEANNLQKKFENKTP